MTRRLKVISTKVTEPLAKAIEEYLLRGAYVTASDFARDAIREKLKKDAPNLFAKMLADEKEEKDQG